MHHNAHNSPAMHLLMCVSALLLAACRIQPSLQAPAAAVAMVPDEAALREIFIGRCDEFQLLLHPELFAELKNCSLLWDKFRAAALGSGGCQPDPEDFRELMLLADHKVPTDKSVFWSGVYALMNKMQDLPDYFSIEKTLIGYTMNSLDWCRRNCSGRDSGSSQSELPDHQMIDWAWIPEDEGPGEKLRSEENCNNFTLPFWIAASKWFAAKSLGRASVILNASVASPFRETSIFGQYELPLISSARVTFMNIYLVNSLHDPQQPGGSCSEDSVMRLQLLLRRKGIPARCTQNPDFLVHILCADQPDAERCRFIGGSSDGRLRPSLQRTAAAVAFALAVVLGGAGRLRLA